MNWRGSSQNRFAECAQVKTRMSERTIPLLLSFALGCSATPQRITIAPGANRTYTATFDEAVAALRRVTDRRFFPKEDTWLLEGNQCHDVGLVSTDRCATVDDERIKAIIAASPEDVLYLMHNHPYAAKHMLYSEYGRRRDGESDHDPPSDTDFLLLHELQVWAEKHGKQLKGVAVDHEGRWVFAWERLSSSGGLTAYRDCALALLRSQMAKKREYGIFFYTNVRGEEYDFEPHYQKLREVAEGLGLELEFERHK